MTDTSKKITLVEPVQIGEATYTEFELIPPMLSAFAKAYEEVQEATPAGKYIPMQSVFMVANILLWSGSLRKSLEYSDWSVLPALAGMQLRKVAMNYADHPKGEVISPGDCITKSCTFKLGTPLTPEKGEPITELEFFANSYAQVEPILAATNDVEKVLELVRTSATCSVISSIPEKLIEKITFEDGMALVTTVLPDFLSKLNGLETK